MNRVYRTPLQCWSQSLLLSLCASLCIATAHAANTFVPFARYAYQTWSTESGLPQVTTADMVRDADGYLWVATRSGLARFDGAHFEVFDPSNTTALKAGWMVRLFRDSKDRIWIATTKNLARREGGNFTEVTGGGMQIGETRDIAEDGAGHVCVAAIKLWCEKGDQLIEDTTWQDSAQALATTPEGLWIAGKRTLELRHNGAVIRTVLMPGTPSNIVINRLVWWQDSLWAATSAGLFRANDGVMKVVALETGAQQPNVQALAVATDDTLWAGGYEAVYRLVSGALRERIGVEMPQGFAWVISLYPDADGAMWMGSQQDGMRYLWRSKHVNLGAEIGLPNPSVWSFLATGPELLIGTNDGVSVWSDDHFQSLLPGTTLVNPAAYTLMRDRDRRLYVGTRSGLTRVAADGRIDRGYPELATLQINGLAEDPDGTVWVASSGGLFHIDEAGVHQLGSDAGVSAVRIRYLLFDHSGQLWVGTEDGLFTGRNGHFTRSGVTEIGNAFVSTLLQLHDGRIVAGTYDSGIFMQDGAGWVHLGSKNGLPSENAYFLGEHNDFLIVSFANGLYRVKLAALAAATQQVPIEMLLLDEGNRIGRSRLRCCNGGGNGKGALFADAVWLPTLNGVARVPLAVAPEAPLTPHILAVGNSRQLPADGAELALPVHQQTLEIRYDAIDFGRVTLPQFRYRLAGFDKDWVAAGQRTEAIYTNLPPGHYSFEVQARRAYAPWSASTKSDLYIPATFAESVWFKGLAATLLAMILWVLLRWRLRREQRQKERLEETIRERTRALEQANLQLASANAALAEASVTDPLTGLHNRRFILEQIGNEIASLHRQRSRERKDLVIGCFVIDIDHFKAINDNFGHGVGDLVLQRVAKALISQMREGDHLARWGGEEFVLISTAALRADLAPIAERLREVFTQLTGSADEPEHITASVGYAAYPVAGIDIDKHDWQATMDLADHALYGAKAAGRDRVATVELTALGPLDWPGRVSAAKVGEWYVQGKAHLLVGTSS